MQSRSDSPHPQTNSLPENRPVSLCLIDTGGGLRGIYAAGVLDALMDCGLEADLCIGVSAGSANLATFLSGQSGRCYRFYHDYAFRKDYASLSNLMKKHSFFDFDYIYSTLSNQDGEDPLDYPALCRSNRQLLAVATNAVTGRPIYFDLSRISQDDYSVMKASCSVPYLCHPNAVAHVPCVDGTVSDPLPVEKALQMGAEKIVILSPGKLAPLKERSTGSILISAAAKSRFGRAWPAIYPALKRRSSVYNRSLALARTLEKQGRALLLCPASDYGVHALFGRADQLDALYQQGREDAVKVLDFLDTGSAGDGQVDHERRME